MANTDYTQELQRIIFRFHHTETVHFKSVPVSDETVWQGTVEVFQLTYSALANGLVEGSGHRYQSDDAEYGSSPSSTKGFVFALNLLVNVPQMRINRLWV